MLSKFQAFYKALRWKVDNSLDYELAMEVVDFFQLSEQGAEDIRNHVLSKVANWKVTASKVGLSRAEQQAMSSVFNV